MHGNAEKFGQEIGELLRQEKELADRFATLLAEEYRAVAERDIIALEQLIRDKSDMIEQLAAADRERTRLLAGAGYEDRRTAMMDCLQWCDHRHELSRSWQELQALARTCSELNRRNQRLVDLCCRHAREALTLLRGEETAQGTYEADGAADLRHGSRSLAKA